MESIETHHAWYSSYWLNKYDRYCQSLLLCIQNSLRVPTTPLSLAVTETTLQYLRKYLTTPQIATYSSWKNSGPIPHISTSMTVQFQAFLLWDSCKDWYNMTTSSPLPPQQRLLGQPLPFLFPRLSAKIRKKTIFLLQRSPHQKPSQK